MAKPMRARDFLSWMQQLGFTQRSCKGSHAVFYCPCGKHSLTVATGHGTIAPNVMRSLKNISCVTT